jgi:SAM-dependent methyltransferase
MSDHGGMFRIPNKNYWDSNWAGTVPSGSLSSLNVFNADLKMLFRSLRLTRLAQVAEIGFAPGKTLGWIHDRITSRVVGVDYSEEGCAVARQFFAATGRNVRVLCEDATAVKELDRQMDLVYSIGVLEHFSDPCDMLAAHLRWLKDDGTALVLIPNYSGLYQRLQARLDPKNLEIHNLDSMRLQFWSALQSRLPEYELRPSFHGRPSPWLLSLQKRGVAGRLLQYSLNFAAFPFPRNTPYAANILIVGRRCPTT